VTGLSRKLGEYRKAVASLVTGVLAWGGVVIASKPDPIPAAEWLMLAGVAVTALAVAGVSANDPA
jgi:hypothetical protein